MKKLSMAIIIIITTIIFPTFFSADDDIYIDYEKGKTGGESFSFIGYVGPNYPKSITLQCLDYIYKIGFTYDNKLIIAGKKEASENTYIFQNNEFINRIQMCFSIGNWVNKLILCTNKDNCLSCGSGCDVYENYNHNGYAVAGFYGSYDSNYITSLGIIYHKFYYNCSALESGQLCSYDHREILTTIPDGFFLNDTNQKTIDKCYSSCKQCRNYGNDNDQKCTECFSGFELLDEPGFEFNYYKYCLHYSFDKNTLDYECTSNEFTLINETSNATKNEIIDSLDEIIQKKKPSSSYIINGNDYI